MDIEPHPTVRAAHRPKAAQRGLVIIYTGDGKGKSTAAYGLALRAFGRGKSVKIFQYTKTSSPRVGEHRAFARLGIPIEVLGDGFDWDCRDAEHCIQLARQSWARAKAAILGGEHFMVVLDDFMYPLRKGWLDLDEVLRSLLLRPVGVHVVLTGRNAPQDLIDLADTVTRMALTKHHYMAGVPPQRGIED